MITEDVVVVFENCESAFISKESVDVLWFGDVTENISYTDAGSCTMKVAKTMHLVVGNPDKNFVERCKQYKDITQVQVGEVTYHIEWPEGHDYENPKQTNWYYDDSIMIRVDASQLEDYYD